MAKETEQELVTKLSELRKRNAELALKEINNICKKYNVVLSTNIDVVIGGKPLEIHVVSI